MYIVNNNINNNSVFYANNKRHTVKIQNGKSP